jgi:ubiquinone/menaquinone biosynthesis C-methylase UbiE
MNNIKGQKNLYGGINHNLSSAIRSEESYHPSVEHRDRLRALLKSHVPKNSKKSIDLGSYTGKWTSLLLEFTDELICVDIVDNHFKIIKERFPEEESRLSYRVTDGDELGGVNDGSIDFIVSFDALVRNDKSILKKYFHEFYRVLRPGGVCLVHYTDKPFKGMPVTQDHEIEEVYGLDHFTLVERTSVFPNGKILALKRKK